MGWIGRRWAIWAVGAALAISPVATGDNGIADPGDPGALVHRLGYVQGLVERSDLEAMGAQAKAGREAHPDDARWTVAWVLIEAYQGRAKSVLDDAESAAKALPKDAGAQYALGLCLISTIDDVALWNKGARADRARTLWATALDLDPAHIGARISLIEFYRNAPGIAGGSTKKARELAQTGPDGEGAHLWHTELAAMAADDEDWPAFDAEMDKAAELAPNAAAKRTVIVTRAITLLTEKKDPAAALAVAQPVADSDRDSQSSFACARSLRALGRIEESIPYYRRVVELIPTAENSRIDLGLCLIETGRTAEGRVELERFLKDHPDSDRAKEARKALKALK